MMWVVTHLKKKQNINESFDFEQTDASPKETALRETHEELGIQPELVDVLGEFGPPEFNLRGDMRVWPFVVRRFTVPIASSGYNIGVTGVC